MKYRHEVSFTVESDTEEWSEAYDILRMRGWKREGVQQYALQVPQNATIVTTPVEEPLPDGMILRRKSDGLLEWRAEGRWYFNFTEPEAEVCSDRWDDDEARTRIKRGIYEIIYDPRKNG